MANTFSQIYLQFVFAVRNRQSLIPKEHKEELHRYFTGLVQNRKAKMLAVNCMPDHTHLFTGFRPNILISDFVKELKVETNEFINGKKWVRGKFNWQEGYGVFSYSHSHIDKVINYIKNQELKHKRLTFKQEYLQLLERFQISYEEKYLFNFLNNIIGNFNYFCRLLMNALVAYTINENDFVLSPERVMFWEKEKTLIIADLHIGKTGHFRKSGIPVPQNVFKEDLQRLFSQILFFKAERLIIAGDLSHSKSNKEMDLFKKWRHDLEGLEMVLVNGNHDILEEKWYQEMRIVTNDCLDIESFSFCHDPEEAAVRDHKHYIFCGHLHPGISIRGRGRQFLQFPCFYFGNNIGILPAFSRFTGCVNVNAKNGENVFAIVDNGIMQVQ